MPGNPRFGALKATTFRKYELEKKPSKPGRKKNGSKKKK